MDLAISDAVEIKGCKRDEKGQVVIDNESPQFFSVSVVCKEDDIEWEQDFTSDHVVDAYKEAVDWACKMARVNKIPVVNRIKKVL